MPNDPISQILEMMGVNSYTGEQQRPMARRGRGGVNGAPQSEGYEGDLPDPDNPAQMSRYAQEEAFMPGDPAINSSGMANSPLFQEAVAIFTEQNGHEPATDSDFEVGVVPIMMQLMQGGPTAAGTESDILRQMGEEDGREMDRMNRE